MNEAEVSSLRYFMNRRGCDEQWRDFLHALSQELGAQMSVEEIRAFFYVLGQRMAERSPLAGAESLEQFEDSANASLARTGWGWMRLRDLHSSLELQHSCAPLRAAFGEDAMPWAGALLEGLYAVWMRQLGAGEELELRQIGQAEGPADTLRFRLAHPSLFA